MSELAISASEILAYVCVMMTTIKYNNTIALDTETVFLREAAQISPKEFQTAIGLLSELVLSLNQQSSDDMHQLGE